jgi:hypothetical protein
MKVGKFPLYVDQFFLKSAPDRRTRLQAIASQPQKGSNLAEPESQALHAADKRECLDIGFGVLTESALRSWRSREKCIAFVESNRVNAEANLLCNDANLHGSLAPS